ncbi:Uncharacterised protein [uncultured Clostridium sp.]|nr:Uncharacterised protein [uncultured Clostridium sp.]
MKERDHRVRVTRMLLRRALCDLLRQKPLQNISIKELCAQAGVNRGTFYAHYTDLHGLLGQMEEEMLGDFRQALEPLLAVGEDHLTPADITAGIFELLKENADLCTVTLGPYGDKAFALRLLNIGREAYMEAYSRLFAGASPKQLAYFYAFVSAGCIGLMQKWLDEGMAIPAQEAARMAEGFMVGGMGSLQGPR